MFQPKTEYTITSDIISIKDFHDYPEDFVVRPPYQRKNVWSKKKQQALLDSLFRRYYVPKLVLREVRLNEDKVLREVVDGQQRIVTVQKFFNGELRLPTTLKSLDQDLAGKLYGDLSSDHRKFTDKHLKYEADIIGGIDEPKDPRHQTIATEIFWRLQQGESLNFMEIAHARLSSRVRNFLVKHGDDISFDHESYKPVDANPDKHPFFTVIEKRNDRMQHLALLGRLLLIERAGGPTDIRDAVLGDWIDQTKTRDGIGDFGFESDPTAASLLRTLSLFFEVFRDDPAVDEKSGVRELRVEYFIISTVMLLGYLRKNYALGDGFAKTFRSFIYEFHQRWRAKDEKDQDVVLFSDSRQQSPSDLEVRERIIRRLFFEYLRRESLELKTLDGSRAFNEAERILIYRRQNGQCQMCLEGGLSPKEAQVSWSDYQADHIEPWVKGGRTEEWNGQVLCSTHNQQKGAT